MASSGGDGVHEVPNDAVGAYRTRTVGELVLPFLNEGVSFPGHLGGRVAVLTAVADDVAAGVYHLAQHQLGVADDGVVDVVVLVDVGGIVGGVDHGLARRHGHHHVVPGEAGPDAEYYVGAAQEIHYRRG